MMRLKHLLALTLIAAVITCANGVSAESARITPIVKVVREWSGAVVNISTERVILLRTHPFWGQFGGMIGDPSVQNMQTVGTMQAKSIGSGVVISKDGLILTNAHVVQMANKIFVTLSDGKQAEAVIMAVSPENDLALIKISPPENIKPVRIAEDAMIGETVIAVGNPLGLENSVSVGVISGLDRNIIVNNQVNPALTGLIQTDTSINQGSSGGALLNLDGELVGINLAVIQGANSIAFAIPYTKIKNVLKQYREAKEAPASAVNVVKIPVQ